MPRGAALIPTLAFSARFLLAGALALATGAAQAQAPRETRGAPAGTFDFYVLALSWSPGFCEASGDAKARAQCDAGAGLGFVVHGLWPQYEEGYPSFCTPANRQASRPAVEEAKGVFPEEGLARYQWRKHGSCSGLDPAAYFRATRQARDFVRLPSAMNGLRQQSRLLPAELERAFTEANPGLRPDMIAVSCGRRILQEVRVCLTRDLRGFRSCPEVDRAGCRAGPIDVPPVR